MTKNEALETIPVGDLSARHLVQICARARGLEIELIAGDQRPIVRGEGAYYTTPSGKTIVHHPNSYGWRTVYHCSTEYIEVGAQWLVRQMRHGWREHVDDSGFRVYVRCGARQRVHGFAVAPCRDSGTGCPYWLVSDDTGWTYHYTRTNASRPWAAVRAALRARTKQRRADRAAALERAEVRGIVVTPSHSVGAGNCIAGMYAWIRRHLSDIDVAEDGISIDAARLLEIDPSSYARRAIAIAAEC